MRHALPLLLFAAGTSIAAADADPVRAKLDRAKAAFQAESDAVRKATADDLDRREDMARRDGNKKLLDAVKAERQAYEASGELPTVLPATVKARQAAAKTAVEAAYAQAVRDYIRAKKDDLAAGVEKERDAYRAAAVRPRDAAEFDKKFYKVYPDALTWQEARKRCEAAGGRLAVVTSAEENQFVTKLAAAANVGQLWLGATDEKREGKWGWVDGTELKYTRWAKGQPDNWKGIEHYLFLHADDGGLWGDRRADPAPPQHKPGYVCQWD